MTFFNLLNQEKYHLTFETSHIAEIRCLANMKLNLKDKLVVAFGNEPLHDFKYLVKEVLWVESHDFF